MITNARVLREGWVPRDLEHRDGQVGALTSALQPITRGEPGEHVLITGPSGVGKTTIANYALQKLEEEVFGMRWGYVNCITDSTTSAVLHKLTRDGNVGSDLRREGTPTADFLDRLRDLDDQFVAILDEVDVLADHDILRKLYSLPNVTLVLVTVDENDLFANMDSRVHSRLRGLTSITLGPYSYGEMRDILRSREKAGLEPGAVDGVARDEIINRAGGDARHAITLLRKAARHAEGRGESIEVHDVEAVCGDVEGAIRQRRVSDLSSDKRLLYEIVQEAGSISAPELRRRYKQQRESPVASRTRRKYIRALERYELIDAEGTGKGKTLHAREV